MKPINENTQYTIAELSRITGLETTRFYAYKDLLEMEKRRLPSGRIGYAVHMHNFENVLNASKTYPFEIHEFAAYTLRKRPIQRQFFSIVEARSFMSLIGDDLSIYTVKRRVREGRIPAYALNRKYLIPILHLIKRYSLPIDNELNNTISHVIKQSYRFKL